VLFEEAVDRGLQIDDRMEYAPLQSSLCQRGEEPFDSIEPRARSRRKVEREPFMPVEPLTDLRVLVRRVIVEDHMNRLAGGNLRLDGVEEADELLMPMALHVAAYDRAIENVQRGEQRRCSVPFVIMRHGSGTPLLQRQARFRSIERLNLALFIHRKHNGVRWRIDIEPDDIAQFVDELRIVRELELPDAMRLKPGRRLHLRLAKPDRTLLLKTEAEPPHTTRYDKTTQSYLGFAVIGALRIWIRHFVNTA
jgi:hypothetical protein